MKNLIPFLLIFLIIGCNSNDSEIESIEIMTYYYAPNNEQTKLITDLIDYSKIDENGNVETIKKIESSESKYLTFKSKIDSKLITQIELDSKNKDEKYYETKIDTNSLHIYCGPTIRAKVKYKNNKVLSFTYGSRKDDLKFSLYIKIQSKIFNNYNKMRFQVIDSIPIRKSQKEFEKFALNRDTLNLAIPQMPRSINDQVKFPPPSK